MNMATVAQSLNPLWSVFVCLLWVFVSLQTYTGDLETYLLSTGEEGSEITRGARRGLVESVLFSFGVCQAVIQGWFSVLRDMRHGETPSSLSVIEESLRGGSVWRF